MIDPLFLLDVINRIREKRFRIVNFHIPTDHNAGDYNDPKQDI